MVPSFPLSTSAYRRSLLELLSVTFLQCDAQTATWANTSAAIMTLLKVGWYSYSIYWFLVLNEFLFKNNEWYSNQTSVIWTFQIFINNWNPRSQSKVTTCWAVVQKLGVVQTLKYLVVLSQLWFLLDNKAETLRMSASVNLWATPKRAEARSIVVKSCGDWSDFVVNQFLARFWTVLQNALSRQPQLGLLWNFEVGSLNAPSQGP